MTITETKINNSPLGKKINYNPHYQRDLLFAIPRQIQRLKLSIVGQLPFKGEDIWNAYEISWLNLRGKPEVALGEFIFPCDSPNLIESKSLKLYLNSFNNTQFASIHDVMGTIRGDLSEAAGCLIKVNLTLIENYPQESLQVLTGKCLDYLDIECDTYTIEPKFLRVEKEEVEEVLYSNLLKSNCLVTGQPDWASIQIHYAGKKINHEGLLKYIISFRNHPDFHEHCVERIFSDINRICSPKKLSVFAKYTRRGGLDINPFRTLTDEAFPKNSRLCRQ